MRLVSGMFGNEKYFEANFERLSGGPSPIETYPAEPREGCKGGALGSGGQKRQDKEKKNGGKEDGIYTQTGGSADFDFD